MGDRETPLQAYLRAFRDTLEDAREELDGDGWRAFVWIATEIVGHEAARVAADEALEATKGVADDA